MDDVTQWTVAEIKGAIQSNYQQLSDSMKPSDVIPVLFQKGVLSPREKQELEKREQNNGSIAQAELLLDKMMMKDDEESLTIFTRAMYKTNKLLWQVLKSSINQQRKGEISFNKSGKCASHKQEITEFCEKCQEAICERCIAGDHRKHTTHKVKDIEENFHKLLSPVAEETWKLVHFNTERMSDNIEESFTMCSEAVEQEAERLTEEITQAKVKLIKQLDKEKEAQVKRVKHAGQCYKKERESLRRMQEMITDEWQTMPKGSMTLEKVLQFKNEKCEQVKNQHQTLDSTLNLDVVKPFVKPGPPCDNILGKLTYQKEGMVNLRTNQKHQRHSSADTNDTKESDFAKTGEVNYHSTDQSAPSEETFVKFPDVLVSRLAETVEKKDRTRSETQITQPTQSSGKDAEDDWLEETVVKVTVQRVADQYKCLSDTTGWDQDETDVKQLAYAAGGTESMVSAKTIDTHVNFGCGKIPKKKHKDLQKGYELGEEKPKLKMQAPPISVEQTSRVSSAFTEVNKSQTQSSVKEGRQETGTRYFKGYYQSCIKMPERNQCAIKLNGECRRMACFDQCVWAPVSDRNKILVYKSDGRPAREISMKSPVAVCNIGGVVFVACGEEGIFQLQASGSLEETTTPLKVAPGSFSDVCSVDGKLYAWEYKCKKIVCFERSKDGDGKYEVKREVAITVSNKKKTSTSDKLIAHQTTQGSVNFFLSEWSGHTILHIDENGKVLQKYGSKSGGGDSNLNNPFVCGVDSVGNVLIADQKNNAFKVVNRSSGEWKRIRSTFPTFVYDIVVLADDDIWTLGYDKTSVLYRF